MAAGPGGSTQDEVRRHNVSTLLRYVHVHGPTSRAELTSAMQLNRSTIGTLTADLAGAGLVREELPARTAGAGAGRPSLVVWPRPEQVYVLAFDIGVDYLIAARVGLGGSILDRRELYRPRGDYAMDDVVAHLCRFTAEMSARAESGSVCVGVGAAIAGVVRENDGLVRFAPNLGWVDEPLGRALAEGLGRLGIRARVAVANDADLGALAEHVRGAAAGAPDAVYLTGEVGVGAGIIVSGEPLRGHGGYGGELGHMVVNPAGRLCRCGARGCWETEIGEKAILDAAGHPDGPRATVPAVVAAAAGGDPRALAALRHVGEWLTIGVGNLVNIFNPEVVIFGGLLRDLFPAVEQQLRSTLLTIGLSAPREQVRLVAPGLGADSTLMGAAERAFGPLLFDPPGTLALLT
ncbi:MAG TPA: ROK family protein [Actinospica sp.]|nr:ROK family protein [Actinospica sp.]